MLTTILVIEIDGTEICKNLFKSTIEPKLIYFLYLDRLGKWNKN